MPNNTATILEITGPEKEEIQDRLINKAKELCDKIYDSLPDGIHEHADGELYIHQTYSDPRTGASFKSINKL